MAKEKTPDQGKTSITFEMPNEILNFINKTSQRTGLSKVNLFCRALVLTYEIPTENESYKTKIENLISNQQ